MGREECAPEDGAMCLSYEYRSAYQLERETSIAALHSSKKKHQLHIDTHRRRLA
jgi:hypothetical protein